MIWLLGRQHRAFATVTATMVAAFAVVLATTGMRMSQVYADAVSSCQGVSQPTLHARGSVCTLVGPLFRGYGAVVDSVALTLGVPLVLGLCLGATLVARENDHGTHVLAWTQTVTRRRWLFSKVGAALAAAALVSAAVAALVTWWSGTPNSLYGNRFEGAQFDTQNVLPVAHTLFAVGLGLLAGAVVRRSLPAIALTVAGYAAAGLAVGVWVRPHLAATSTVTSPPFQAPPIPSGSWTVRSELVDPTGHPVAGALPIPASCEHVGRDLGFCLGRLGYHMTTAYHPAAQYWRMQLLEAGVFVGLAAALVTAAVIVTLRRDA